MGAAAAEPHVARHPRPVWGTPGARHGVGHRSTHPIPRVCVRE